MMKMTNNKLTLNFNKELETQKVSNSFITSSDELLKDLNNFIEQVLFKKFPTSKTRQSITTFSNRISFSCPYCGDSQKTSRLKRGNIFFENQMFKCFNCSVAKPVTAFVREWKNFLNLDELPFSESDFKKFKVLSNPSNRDINADILLSKEIISKYRFDREFIRRRFKFEDIKDNETAEKYLKQRFIPFNKWEYFDWDPKFNSVIIYNLDEEGFVLSFSKRSLDKNNPLKYKICDSRWIHKELNRDIEDEDEFNIVNKLFSYFNLFRINFNGKITITEGQMDSLFYPNTFSLNSLAKNIPFEMDECRYLLDFDKSGIEKTKKLLLEGKTVFMWKKFIRDNNLKLNLKNKIDLNDFIIFVKKNKIDMSSLNMENYFTNKKLDCLHLL